MDFIKKLPMSDGFNMILVIIDCLTKQSIFILTVDTITSPMLAKLLRLQVTTLRVMDRQNALIRLSNSTSESIATTSRATDPTCYP